MYFSKKNKEAVEEEETSVWTCSNESCSCWMRDNFSFKESPTCPICSSVMEKDVKTLPALHNSNNKK